MKIGRLRMLGMTTMLWAWALAACGGGDADGGRNGGAEAIFPQATDPYTVEQAVRNGDVVNVHGEYSNVDKWTAFLANVDNRTADRVRITQYTIEGDPIFYELVYDGRAVVYTFDNAMDGYGVDQGRPSTVCEGFDKRVIGNAEGYVLTGCDDEATARTFWFSAKE